MTNRALHRRKIIVSRTLLNQILRNIIPNGHTLVTIDDRDVLTQDLLYLITEPDSD